MSEKQIEIEGIRITVRYIEETNRDCKSELQALCDRILTAQQQHARH